MNTGNEQFERDFEAFLRDDETRLSALYRKLPQAGPDARLDDAVRAMARRALAATPRRASASRRWMPAVGIAAVLALAAGIGLRLAPQLWQRSQPALPEVTAPASAPAAPVAQDMLATPSAEEPAAMNAITAKRAAEAARAPEAEQRRFENPPPIRQIPPPPPPPAPALKPLPQTAPVAPQQTAAPAAPAAAAATAEALPQSASAPEARRTRKAMPAAPTEADAPVPDANIRLYPEHWLANIRQMLREHRRDEALRSLDRFRKQYPDYRLPDDLRDLR